MYLWGGSSAPNQLDYIYNYLSSNSGATNSDCHLLGPRLVVPLSLNIGSLNFSLLDILTYHSFLSLLTYFYLLWTIAIITSSIRVRSTNSLYIGHLLLNNLLNN